MPLDYAIHSDFLVHWTGKDLDSEFDRDWYTSGRSNFRRENPLAKAYVERLRDVLKYGLWLTEESECRFKVGGDEIVVPKTPKTCFTELRLSESRSHASRYGRLGIGVKRPYLFDRFGRPLTYFGFHSETRDQFLKACASDLKDKRLLNFFQPMNRGRPLNDDLYDESEWRILFFNELVKSGRLIDPRNSKNVKEHAYFRSLTPLQQEKLKYLAPLDGWFALIIYPSIGVKNLSQQQESSGIREEVLRIKNLRGDHGNDVEGGNWPIELNLDACRHF